MPGIALASPPTSNRLDNQHCCGDAKDSDENQVTASQRKTTTQARKQGKRDQLPHT
jgi:hypothetical protein